MSAVETLGLIAAALTTFSFLPQALLVLKTRRTDGISLVMYAMFTTGVAAWLAYGFMIGSTPVIVANAITLMLAASILGMKTHSVLQARAHGATAATSAPI